MAVSISKLMDMSGRVAVITGGAGHIGRAAAYAMAELGATVVLLDLDEQKTVQEAENIQKEAGAQALGLAVNLSDEASVRSVCPQVLKQYGRLDVLVNCAAFVGTSNLTGWATAFSEQSADTWRAAMEVNLTAPFVLVQSCADALAANGCGSIVNIASIYGMVGPDLRLYDGTKLGNPAAYAASKGGLLQFTRWLSTVLAPRVRVNAVTPGGIARNQPSSFVEAYVSRTPMKRMGTEEDLIGAIVYLASDLSNYVTGQNLVVDGGWTAW